MKNYIFLSLILFFSCDILAQNSETSTTENSNSEKRNYTRHRWQVGSIISNLAVQQISGDINYRYHANQVIGFGISRIENYPINNMGDEESLVLLNRRYRGWQMAAYQKIYLSRDFVDNMVYFKHGLRGDLSQHHYSREDWFEIVKDGNTFLSYEERDFSESNFRLGYDATIGLELYHGRFSTDIFIGAAYHKQIDPNAFTTENDSFFVPSYSGFRPLFGLRLAINIGPTEYEL